MGKWYVTEADEGDPMTWSGEATDGADAAEQAVEHWHDRGAWAGEEVPHHVDVRAHSWTDPSAVRRVRVAIDWEPLFTATETS